MVYQSTMLFISIYAFVFVWCYTLKRLHNCMTIPIYFIGNLLCLTWLVCNFPELHNFITVICFLPCYNYLLLPYKQASLISFVTAPGLLFCTWDRTLTTNHWSAPAFTPSFNFSWALLAFSLNLNGELQAGAWKFITLLLCNCLISLCTYPQEPIPLTPPPPPPFPLNAWKWSLRVYLNAVFEDQKGPF